MMASGAGSLVSAGVRVRTSSKVCTMCTPSRLSAPPAHFTQRQNSCNARADHQARWAGAWGGGEGSELEALEWREEDVDMWRWRAWWRLGEWERLWRGLGVEDRYRGRGEGVVDMGRRWCAWRRPGERERRRRGLGVGVADGRRREWEAWWGLWGEGVVDMGRRWRAWWRLGERERRERGPGGSWWRLGEREQREWVVEACWRWTERERRGWVHRAGEGGRSAAVCGTGPGCWRRSSQEVSAGPGGPRAAPPGTEGGREVTRPPLIRRVGVRQRQGLVVRVE